MELSAISSWATMPSNNLLHIDWQILAPSPFKQRQPHRFPPVDTAALTCHVTAIPPKPTENHSRCRTQSTNAFPRQLPADRFHHLPANIVVPLPPIGSRRMEIRQWWGLAVVMLACFPVGFSAADPSRNSVAASSTPPGRFGKCCRRWAVEGGGVVKGDKRE